MAFVRSEGMCQASIEEVTAYRGKFGTSKHIDKLGKMTPCLVGFKKLEEIWGNVGINQDDSSGGDSDFFENRPLSFQERDMLVVEMAAKWMQD